MGLMDAFKGEKERLQTPAEKAKAYYESDVLPRVQMLLSQINADPDIKATITNTGDAAGLTHSERRQWYIFKVNFENKSTGTSEGFGTLKINSTEPRYFSPFGFDLGTEDGRNQAIMQLVRQAAESKAKPREARPPRSERPIRGS